MREKTLVNKGAHAHARWQHAYPCRQYTRMPARAIGAPAAHARRAIAPAHAINVSMHAIDTSIHTIDAHACNRHVRVPRRYLARTHYRYAPSMLFRQFLTARLPLSTK